MNARIAIMLTIAVAALSGCSNDDCQTNFSGNYTDAVSSPSCAKLVPTTSGDWQLQLTSTSAKANMTLTVQIDVGTTPAPGMFSSENVAKWQAVSASSQNCEYSAGNAAIPTGNFTLNLTQASTTTTPHGTLQLQQYVQAPATVDCGSGNVENVDFTF